MSEIVIAVIGNIGLVVDFLNSGENFSQTFRKLKSGLSVILSDKGAGNILPVSYGKHFFDQQRTHRIVIQISRRAQHREFQQDFPDVLQLIHHAEYVGAAGHQPETAVFVGNEYRQLLKELAFPVFFIRGYCKQPSCRFGRIDFLHKAAAVAAITYIVGFDQRFLSASRTLLHFGIHLLFGVILL